MLIPGSIYLVFYLSGLAWGEGAEDRLTIPGKVLVLADFNNDRSTDLLVQRDAQTLSVYMASLLRPEYGEAKEEWMVTVDTSGGALIYGAAVSDFDGDSFTDILITTYLKAEYSAQIVWGASEGGFDQKNRSVVGTFSDEPSIVDCNVDGILDVYGVRDGQRLCHLGSTNRQLSGNITEPFNASTRAVLIPSSPAVVDMDGNLNPSLVVAVDGGKGQSGGWAGFEVWSSLGDTWSIEKVVPAPAFPSSNTGTAPKLMAATGTAASDMVFGLPTFNDFTGDGKVDILLPTLLPSQSDNLAVSIWSNNAWHLLRISLTPVGAPTNQWSFVASLDKPAFNLVRFRSGDIDQDGYPDLLLIFTNGTQYPFLLKNVPCDSAANCGNFSRTFKVGWVPLFSSVPTRLVKEAAFIDVSDDGNLDLLFLTQSSQGAGWSSQIAINQQSGDTCFLLVQAFTSTCSHTCENGAEGTGIAMSGACLRYEGTNPDGSRRQGSNCLLPQSSHNPLSLPTVVFGLGRTPNFVESLKLGIPSPAEPRNQSWFQIIPNSRIYIIPYPAEYPKYWISRLFLTPSRLILLSVAALSCICGIILLIIIILHMKERRTDRKERSRQTHKFHFNAM